MLSVLVTAGTSGRRLRRAIADPCRAMDRGVMSPAALLSGDGTAEHRAHDTPPAVRRDGKPACAEWFPPVGATAKAASRRRFDPHSG